MTEMRTLTWAVDVLAQAVLPGGQPAFPSLREPCAYHYDHAVDEAGVRHPCHRCGGAGYTVRWPGIGPTLADARALGWGWDLRDNGVSIARDYDSMLQGDYLIDLVGDPSEPYDELWAIALARAATAAGLAQEAGGE